MSYDNHYPRRKDWRRQYHDCRSFDRSCRSGGSDPWMIRNRLHADRKRREGARCEIADYVGGEHE